MQKMHFVVPEIDEMTFKENGLFCSNQIHLMSLSFFRFYGLLE